jgi:hypothetical protein
MMKTLTDARQSVIRLLAVFLLSACGVKPVVQNRLTLGFYDDTRRVHVNTETRIGETSNSVMEERATSLREAIAGNRDEWSLRYNAVRIEDERLTIDRHDGKINRVERLSTIDRDDLPRFFDDMSVTISLLPNAGGTELTIIPGASNRATRQQRERVLEKLHSWSHDAAAYFEALGHLYAYLDEHPERAETAFTLYLGDHDQKSTIEQEQALIDALSNASERLVDRMHVADTESLTIDEEFDLVFNPFPAEIVVHAPRAIVFSENFDKRDDSNVVIPRRGLLDAITTLEGKWITPDPLAMSLRGDIKPADLAKLPRHWAPVVTAAEIEKAVGERLKPASVYRVRWME